MGKMISRTDPVILQIICQMDLEKALWKMVLIDLKLIMEIYLCGDI